MREWKSSALIGSSLQNMRGSADAGIAARLLELSPFFLKHLLQGLSAVSDSLCLAHLDLLQSSALQFRRRYDSHISVHSSIRMVRPGGRKRVVAGASITASPGTSLPGFSRSMS